VPATDVVRIESVAAGTDPATIKLREKLTAVLEKATKRMRAAQGYRAFASSVVEFLTRLRARNSRFVAGTYPRHVWAEYSGYVFLPVPEDADGFYERPETESFLDNVNAAALNGSGPYGAFRWHAVYTDARMADRINSKYGAGRVPGRPVTGRRRTSFTSISTYGPVDLSPDALSGSPVHPNARARAS